MKKSTNKTLLVILLSIVCALIIVGAGIAVYNYIDDNINTTEENNDGWTGNY